MVLLSGPNISGNEWKYVKDCLDTAWVSSVGAYVTQFENMVAEYAGAKYGVAAVNGTAALHIALKLSGVVRDDLVIVPNITFIASVNSIKYTGASPVLMDIDQDTWQMDLDLLDSFLLEKTRKEMQGLVHIATGKRIGAIMPVHVLGNMCDMERLMKIANKYEVPVVEDSTEALGSYFNGKHAGSFGQFGCFSFNGNKLITTGGGGVIVTDDEELAKRAKHITTQAKADPMEYYHDEIGYNYRLVNVLAAIGVAQMELLPQFIERKKEVDQFYRSQFENLEGVVFQKVLEGCNPNRWLFTFSSPQQKELLKELNGKKLQSRPFWVPMNRLPMFGDEVYYTEKDVAGQVYDSCLSIPCSTNITDEELEMVADTVKKVMQGEG